MATKFFGSEREAWGRIAGPQNRPLRRQFQRDFRRMFGNEGHNASIRDFADILRSPQERRAARSREVGKFLDSFHYRAFDLLVKHGVDYTPHVWRGRPKWGEPKTGKCGSNALAFAKANNAKGQELPVVYVEGLALGPVVRPMLHAWNALGLDGTIAYDWTFYSVVKWTRYLGIPLTEAEYWGAYRIFGGTNFLPLLLHNRCFPNVESYLVDLLAARTEAKAA